ncbi:probable amino acid permease 7 isoform X1 [Cajanus cajan]|uniref:probable amino acid permease 7 isoform X1 n=1 Tax=Cajanus cajan TaxID=3821 RepID=UPI00098DB692|nr:probable amino acid permease 7 isoform X1 [Cajanus cajan]
MGDEAIPLIQPFSSSNLLQQESFKRTGNLQRAVAHIITGVIGAGVLSLAWSVAQLGWISGPLIIIIFACITVLSSYLLSDCYIFPHPQHGNIRCPSYTQAVKLYLGETREKVSGVLVHASLYGTTVAYIITSATSARAILKSNCYHKEGHQAPCNYGDTMYMILFGLVQIIMSFIPDLHNMAWLSVVAAIMSFTYSSIGLGLGIKTVLENGRIMGSLTGVPASNIVDKLWLVFQAIGDIAFAYPYTVVLLEIQDTLESPSENKTMKKASTISILITTFFYLCCGCFGYAAFGNQTPGNLLTGFGFYEPYWLIDFANACIIVHLIGGYQIFSQPIYGAFERWCSKKYPNSGFVNNFYQMKLPRLPTFQLNVFRLCFRTAYVVSTTGLALLFPYFNQILGVLGAITFWPLAIYFPVEMHFVQRNIEPWSRKWIVFRTFSFICFLVSLFGLIASLEGIISQKLS